MQSNTSFRLTGILKISDSVITISQVREDGRIASFTDESLLIQNEDGTIIERCVGTAKDGVLTLSKRGLDYSESKLEELSNKLERRPWSLVSIVMFASDLLDKEWAGPWSTQTVPSNNVYTWETSFNDWTTIGKFALPRMTEAERDAELWRLNGHKIFNTTTWLEQTYNGGVWTDVANGATANASETVWW